MHPFLFLWELAQISCVCPVSIHVIYTSTSAAVWDQIGEGLSFLATADRRTDRHIFVISIIETQFYKLDRTARPNGNEYNLV